MKIRAMALLTLFAICTCISLTADASNPFIRPEAWKYSSFSETNGKYNASVQGFISREIDGDNVSVWILRPGNSEFTEYEISDNVATPLAISVGNIGDDFFSSFDATVSFPIATTNSNVFFKYGYPDGSNIVFSPTFALCTNSEAMEKPCCDGVAKKGNLSVRVTSIVENNIDKYQIGMWVELPAEEFDENSTVMLQEMIDGHLYNVPGAAVINRNVIETGYLMLSASAIKPRSEATKDLTYVLRYKDSNAFHYLPDAGGFLVCDLAMDPKPEFCQAGMMTITPLKVPLVMLPSGEIGQPELGEPPVLEEGTEEVTPEEAPLELGADLESGAPEPADPEDAPNATKASGVGGYDWLSGCSLSPNAKHYGGLTLVFLLLVLIPPLVVARIRRKK